MTANRQTAVGAFVLGGVILALGAVVLFGKFDIFHPPIRAAIVFQDSISGLNTGSPVTFRGVQVGAVDGVAIKLDPTTHAAYIPVNIHVNPAAIRLTDPNHREDADLSGLIAAGLRAELATMSFVTGQSEIDLDFAPTSVAVLHPGITGLEEIPTQKSAIQKVKEQLSQLPLHELADNSNATLQSLRALSEQLDQDLPPLVRSLEQTSDTSAKAVQEAAASLKDVQEHLDITLADISRLAQTGDRQLTQRGAELHTLLASTNQTMTEAQASLTDIKNITSARSAARANAESTLRDLAAAAASLRGFASDVEHNPQLLLTGRKQ